MRSIIFLIFLPFTLFGQSNTSVFDTYMKAQSDLYGFNGNVLIAKNGTVIYKQSFGYADYNTRKALDDNSRAEIKKAVEAFKERFAAEVEEATGEVAAKASTAPAKKQDDTGSASKEPKSEDQSAKKMETPVAK